MESFDINLGAGGTAAALVPMRRAGYGFEVIAANYNIDINFLDVNGGQTNTIKNGFSGLFLGNDFGAFEVFNRAGNPAQTVTVLVFDRDENGGSRRQPGIVNVVDAGKTRTLSGQSFMGQQQFTAGAATYASVQLFNPVGSGKRVVIEAASMTGSLAGNLILTLISASQVNGGNGHPKLSGGANSTAVLQYASSATYAGLNPSTGDLQKVPNLANTAYPISFKEPVVLLPSYGLMVVSDQNASPSVTGVFEFFEESL
jgi:hypothetical protein